VILIHYHDGVHAVILIHDDGGDACIADIYDHVGVDDY
jgi:hypothetical protein